MRRKKQYHNPLVIGTECIRMYFFRTKNCKNSKLSFQQTIRAALNDCRNIWLPAEGAIKIIWLPSVVGQDEIPNSPNCPPTAMITTGTRREKVYEYNVWFYGSYSGSERTWTGAISRRRWTYLLREMSYAGSMPDHIWGQRKDHALHLQMPEGRTGTAGTAHEGGRTVALCPSSESDRHSGATSSGLDICVSDRYSQRPDGEAICGELEEGQSGKPWPIALGRCWNRKIIPGRLYC